MDQCLFPELDSPADDSACRLDGPIGLVDEHEQLARLFRAVGGGEGRALVIRGECGLGKTTLVDHAVGSVSGFGAARVAGLESERDLPFAGLHRLCAPMQDRVDTLPEPQRDALAAVFGVRPGGSVDLLMVGLGVLGLFADASADEPFVCAVDDADWLDGPSRRVLAFAARRLAAERVALVFTVRERTDDFAGLPELVLRPLTDVDARALLASVVPGPLDDQVRDRIVAESRGNRRELLALRGATSELAGGFGLPPVPTPVDSTTGGLREQVAAVPADTRRLLLVAASEPQGDPALLWRAAAALDLDPASADEATSRGLIELGSRVTFGNPRLRAVVYHDAPFNERRRVHQVLADATEEEADPDRRAWHQAFATLAPDESVASGLERSASRVGQRGGVAAAAAFLERSALLTPDPSLRARRALAAARANLDAGLLTAASELASMASTGPLDELGRARLDLLTAQIAVARGPSGDAPRLVLEAARALEQLDARLGRDGYLEALGAALVARSPGLAQRIADAVTAARAAPAAGSPRVADDLLDGFAGWFAGSRAAAAPTLRRAVEASSGEDDPRLLGLASLAAVELWDDEATFALASRRVRLARQTGALTDLRLALDELGGLHVHAGDFGAAARLLDEARTIATAHAPKASTPLVLAAWRGDEARMAENLEPNRADMSAGAGGRPPARTESAAAAVLLNSLGRYDDALTAAWHACEDDVLISSVVLPELVEAAARAGEHDIAAAAVERLAERTQIAGTEWALGIEARSRAILSDGDAAEKHYREAIERLGRCRATPDRARAHLLYGEWLRRERRRLDARAELRVAHEIFSAMGADAFAARAHHELLATGERARRRTADTADDLTPRESQVAQLARAGDSNPQIGAQLFISARTVEYHLRKVFSKLGIDSRQQLVYALD